MRWAMTRPFLRLDDVYTNILVQDYDQHGCCVIQNMGY